MTHPADSRSALWSALRCSSCSDSTRAALTTLSSLLPFLAWRCGSLQAGSWSPSLETTTTWHGSAAWTSVSTFDPAVLVEHGHPRWEPVTVVVDDRRPLGGQVLDDRRPPGSAWARAWWTVQVTSSSKSSSTRVAATSWSTSGVRLEPQELVGVGDAHLALVHLGAHRCRQLQQARRLKTWRADRPVAWARSLIFQPPWIRRK